MFADELVEYFWCCLGVDGLVVHFGGLGEV